MPWHSPVHPQWYSSYTSHLHVKKNLGTAFGHSCDTLSARWQGPTPSSWPAWPRFQPRGSLKGISQGKWQWHPLQFLAGVLEMWWGSVPVPSGLPAVSIHQEAPLVSLKTHRAEKTWQKCLKKLYPLTEELRSRLKESLNDLEKESNNGKYRFGLTLSCLIGIFASWRTSGLLPCRFNLN